MENEKVTGADKCLWVLTEIVILWSKKYLDNALIIWDFIKKYIIGPKDREWNENVSKYEVAERIDTILSEKINKIALN